MRKAPGIKKVLTDYDKAINAINSIRLQATSLKQDKDVIEVAKITLLGIQGKLEEAAFRIKRKPPKLKPGWAAQLPKETIIKVLDVIGGDGHSLFSPAAFIEAGLPKNIVKAFTDVIPSDMRNPKGMIFDHNGRLLSHLKGVYGLHLLGALARSLGAPTSSALGRGFEARQLDKNIRDHLDPPTEAPPAEAMG